MAVKDNDFTYLSLLLGMERGFFSNSFMNKTKLNIINVPKYLGRIYVLLKVVYKNYVI